MKNKLIFIIIILLIGGGIFFGWFYQKNKLTAVTTEQIPSEPTTYTKHLEIIEGKTYGILMSEAGCDPNLVQEILTISEEVYDLSSIKLGKTIDLVYDKDTDELKKLVYQANAEEELFVDVNHEVLEDGSVETFCQANLVPIEYDIKIKTAGGTIKTSMYQDALDQGIDERAIIGFAEAFQWTIDFAWEVHEGDQYKFVYEERYLDGEYIMSGKILAGKFINQGKIFYAFHYEESEDNQGFFNELGESAEKIFLKVPVAFKYISSGYTNGLRYVKAFNVSTGHRAIDYAATYGSPIWSVGDGTVSFAGWNGGYGNMVTVRHNGTYQTNYGHMSKIAVRVGQQVTQGQTIGYVGSTGFSTGPHVHYEMVKNGAKINPQAEVLPPSKGIGEENKPAYLLAIADLKNQLDN